MGHLYFKTFGFLQFEAKHFFWGDLKFCCFYKGFWYNFLKFVYSDNGFEDDNGWDVEDDVELDASEATNDFDLEAITNQAR